MDIERALQAIREGDRAAVDLCRGAPPRLVEELTAIRPDLEGRSLRVVVACLEAAGSPEAANLLLDLTDDDDLMVAAAAADALFRAHSPPPADRVLAAAPRRAEPVLRGRLYRLAGQIGDESTREALRQLPEPDAGAAFDVLLAIAKLGGAPEREDFALRVERAVPEQALELGEALQYVGDRSLPRALLPWLSQTDPVLRLGGDNERVPRMARMCDVAVIFARQLGVAIPGPPELAVYDRGVLEAAERLLSALPPWSSPVDRG
jgi:HEAT repeat protein